MTSILPSARSSLDAILEQVGGGLSQTLPQAALQRSNREAMLNSLGNLRNVANSGGSPLDVTLAAMQAGAGIPGSEKYLGQIIPMIQQLATANAAGKVGYGKEEGKPQPRLHEPIESIQNKQELPRFMGAQNQNFPTNIGPQNAPGNLPQPATTGEVIPLRTPDQKRKDAIEGAKKSTAEGLPLTPNQYLEQFINPEEQDKKLHNSEVEKERKQRTASQENYGNVGVEELKKVYPNSSPEMDAVFRKKGEEAAGRGKSEGEIRHYLAKEAQNLSDQIHTIQKDLSAPRLQNLFQRKQGGTYKNLEQASNDLRVKLKPLLDLGLYDTARNLVSELGYYPEEIDAIVNPLSERELVTLNRVPKVTGYQRPEHTAGGLTPSIMIPKEYTPQQRNEIKSGLNDLKQTNPNFSLVLARKVFEDKDYDHRVFRDALNEMMQEGFELTDDQRKQLGVLDTPPLRFLDKILHGLNIIGR